LIREAHSHLAIPLPNQKHCALISLRFDRFISGKEGKGKNQIRIAKRIQEQEFP
jgi:hypothetical protein